MFRACDQFVRWSTVVGPGQGSGDEHPTAASHGEDPIGPDTTPDPDDQGVAAAGAQFGQAGPTGELLAAEHAPAVGGEDFEHGPLLSGETLKGVRVLD